MRINLDAILRYLDAFTPVQKQIMPYLVDHGMYYHGFWVFIWTSIEIHDFFRNWIEERVFYKVQSNLKGAIWTGTTLHFGESAWVEQNKQIRDWGEKHGYQFFDEI